MIRALPTTYNGVEFRSRLEARWAVYFDNIGLLWEYELQGYALDAGPYLPDFWLPQVDQFAEVKPCELTELEMTKVRQLVQGTKKGCLLLCGSPRCAPVPLVLPHVDGPNIEIEVTDAFVSNYKLYKNRRFYTHTECSGEADFWKLFYGLFDDVPDAVAAARSAKF